MEKEILKIYTYVDGVKDTVFVDESNPVIIGEYTYTANRMGSVSLSASFYNKQILDSLWDGNQYVVFRGEKYFVTQVPTSTKDNTSDRYKYDVTFNSERSILDGVYFFDVVTEDTENDRYQSNNTNVLFVGDIQEFAKRLNYSLKYSNIDYTVVIDEGVTSETKQVQFEDKFISEALQEFYNTYNVPYYFKGHTIHIGYNDNAIATPFAYGANRELLSITKTNANYKIVNRCSGRGSSDNIPFYYPNASEKGDASVFCPETNTGVTSEDVNIVYEKLFSNNLSEDDKLIYKTVVGEKEPDNLSITDNETGLKFENGVPIKSELTLVDNTFWKVIGRTIIMKFDFTLQNGAEEFKITTDYVNPIALVEVDYHDPMKVDMMPTESFEISKDGSEYTTVLKTFVLQESGTYYVRMNVEFGHVSMLAHDKPYEVSDYSISVGIKRTNAVFDSWTLNGEEIVSLSDYGISLAFGGVPHIDDVISQGEYHFIRTTGALMPSIYRNTEGAERFYNAINDTYTNEDGEFIEFENEYTGNNPKEQIVDFEDIKPTIEGITNAEGLRIDQIAGIAFDADDNDETDEEGNYIHPYFYIKLRKTDGEFGFNIFEHAIVDNTNMTISLTSGNCSACSFEIAVIETDAGEFYNPVQVDADGNIVSGNSTEKIKEDNIQPEQQDTSKREVWIALRKDDSTFGILMPNATYNYKPNVGDNFVILYIELPMAYVYAAEKRLDDAIIKYMAENNSSKFNFSIGFSQVYFAENPQTLALVDENSRLIIEYDNKEYTLYVSSFTYSVKEESELPEVSVELSDTITIRSGTIESIVSSVVSENYGNMGYGEAQDNLAKNTRFFLRKDIDDTAKGRLTFKGGTLWGDFVSGSTGACMQIDKETGQSYAEVDRLRVRLKAYYESISIQGTESVSGRLIISPGGSVQISKVLTNFDDPKIPFGVYRCYFLAEQDGTGVENNFKANDQVISRDFNISAGESEQVANRYYWRLVVNSSIEPVGISGAKYHYVDLSEDDCDTSSDIPKEGDTINQLGNRDDKSRQSAMIFSSVDAFSPSIVLYSGIDSYSYLDKEYVEYGVDNATNKAFFNVYGDAYIGSRDDSSFVKFDTENGLSIKGKLEAGTSLSNGENLEEAINKASEKYKDDFDSLSYLKDALTENTEIEGGVILSSLIALRDTDGNVMSGINGVYDSDEIGGGIGAWWGGKMIDKGYGGDDPVLETPVEGATSLIRMDGSGYFANGAIWWNKEGELHADPLTFFVGEETVGLSLALFRYILKDGTEGTSISDVDYVVPNVPFYDLVINDKIYLGGDVSIGNDNTNSAAVVNGNCFVSGYIVQNIDGETEGTKPDDYAVSLGVLSNVGPWADSVGDEDVFLYRKAGSDIWGAYKLSDLPISGGGGGGTVYHDQLEHLDYPDQHPIMAIAGLQSALDEKADASALSGYLPMSGGDIAGNINVSGIAFSQKSLHAITHEYASKYGGENAYNAAFGWKEQYGGASILLYRPDETKQIPIVFCTGDSDHAGISIDSYTNDLAIFNNKGSIKIRGAVNMSSSLVVEGNIVVKGTITQLGG